MVQAVYFKAGLTGKLQFMNNAVAIFEAEVNMEVISSNVARALSPSISANGNNVYAVWNDDTFGNPEIFFTRSIDSGSTFNLPININNDTGVSDLVQISSGNGGSFYLVWQDNIAGNGMIYLTKTD